MSKLPVTLIVLDGWGYREDPKDNAVAQCKKPNFDALWQKYPHTLLQASGEYVGLPDGQMGNSEIGHTTIGAGTVIATDLVRINKAARAGEFAHNHVFTDLFEHTKQDNSTLHILGLLSPGGIHSHSEHLYAALVAAHESGVKNIALHLFTDGRDTPPQSAAGYFKELELIIAEMSEVRIASVSGRFYSMDRDHNWDRLAKVEELLFENENGLESTQPVSDILTTLYEEGVKDELLVPFKVSSDIIQKNDAVLLFNFRSDRMRMLSGKLKVIAEGMNIKIASMTEYEPGLGFDVAFPPLRVQTTIAKEVSEAGMTQCHIAETEKFPHATYFLDGGHEEPYPGETYVMLDSHKDVPTHDLAPRMRAESIADKALEAIEQNNKFIFINFANPDMVGHTGNVPAIIEGLEEVDFQLQRVVNAVETKGGICIITADHGNAEVNKDPITGQPHTSHTTNPVPCIITIEGVNLIHEGTLADLAPTVLKLMEIEVPEAMTGTNILV